MQVAVLVDAYDCYNWHFLFLHVKANQVIAGIYVSGMQSAFTPTCGTANPTVNSKYEWCMLNARVCSWAMTSRGITFGLGAVIGFSTAVLIERRRSQHDSDELPRMNEQLQVTTNISSKYFK